MNINDLKPGEYNAYYQQYLDKISEDVELKNGFQIGEKTVLGFFNDIPDEKWTYSYADGKWNIKEVLQHLIDTERIFMYRCFRIARHDSTALAGYDQNIYNEPSSATNKTPKNLIDEFTAVRSHSISLLHSLKDEDLKFIGNANNSAMSARAAAFVILGHDIWHMDVIKERYL